MGMGYSASYAESIDDKVLKEICPKEYQDFMDSLDEDGETINNFAQGLMFNDSVGSDKTHELYQTLTEAFTKKTNGAGIRLYYHSSDDNGDRYDDIDGHYWDCSNLFQLSPAGEFLKGKFQRKFFVTFG